MTIDPRDFGRLEATADRILSTLQDHCQDDHDWHEKIDARHEKIDERMRRLEDAKENSAGRQSVISVLSAAVMSIIVAFVGHKIT